MMQSTPWELSTSKSAASYTPFSPPLPSSIANPPFEFMVLNRNDADSTYALWLENGLVKSLVIM